MTVNLNNWVISCDEHYKIINEYIDDIELKVYTYTRPTAQPLRATQFETEAEAQEAIDNLSNEDTSSYKPMKLQDIENKEKERIDKESDAIILNAWGNTSEEKKKEMLDKIRQGKGEEAVQEWLNKYERSENNG